MRRRFSTLLILALATLSFTGYAQQVTPDDPARNIQKFGQFFRYLNSSYVDTVKNDTLIESAIRGALAQLDPHSTYITPEEMISVKESFNGNFSGIGIEFNVLKDTIFVVNVLAGGPSEKVGLLPNDRIIGIDGKSVVGIKTIDVPKILRGEKGTKVEAQILRPGEQKPLTFHIIRDNIPIYTVDAAYKVNPTTGYIRINRFANNTYKEFTDAIAKMGELDALILDLRGNGGGLMDPAIQLSNFFLPKDAVIVSTEGQKVPPEKILAPADGPFTTGKVIVLVNESSASSSEIVSGAIQDWDRGLVIGRRTFGKGLVQRQYPLIDGSAIRLTVARYHTPSGRVIQRPYKNGEPEAYYEDFTKRFENLTDSLPTGDSTQSYKTLRSGRTVYGGGGITPDITIPVDTTAYTPYWGDLIRKGVINEFVIDYMDKNRNTLSAHYPKADKFIHEFTVTDDILNDLIQAGQSKEIPCNTVEFERSKRVLQVQLKAMIAQKLWSINEFYVVVNRENDPYFAKALEVLANWDRYSTGIFD